jgi:hypothetical protein
MSLLANFLDRNGVKSSATTFAPTRASCPQRVFGYNSVQRAILDDR